MSNSKPDDTIVPSREGWWTRDHALIVVLVAVTGLLLFLCALLVQPFFAPIAWALALAVVAHPLHTWIAGKMKSADFAAGVAVLAICIMILAPAVFVTHSIVQEASKGVSAVQAGIEKGTWREQIARAPYGEALLSTVEQQGDLTSQLGSVAADLGKRLPGLLSGSALAFIQLLVTLFVLFYFFRDRRKALDALRSLVPLSEPETKDVIKRVSDTIHATIFGTLAVATVQGALGGLMFWWLGLPAPVLWGAVMALLAIVPVLGAFVVWVPAAIFLAANGQWGKAMILAVWGGVVVALIDNLLYPILVGKRLRLHTVPVFFSIVGGLAVFGAVGLVLGPVILALTDAILQIWRRRTAHGKPAEAAT
jgi:predicted PurR-regulated permease PerM